MTPFIIGRYDALFIGGPLDWQVLEVAPQDALHIIRGDKSEAYYRHLIYTPDCEELLPVYVHETQDFDDMKKPQRFERFFEMWCMCVETEFLSRNAITTAKGLADAETAFKTDFKNVTKDYKRKSTNGSSSER